MRWGRIRSALADRLRDQTGVRPAHLRPVSGYWRRIDCWRWEGVIRSPLTSYDHTIGSYCTMGDCVRHGFILVWDDDSYIEAWSLNHTRLRDVRFAWDRSGPSRTELIAMEIKAHKT